MSAKRRANSAIPVGQAKTFRHGQLHANPLNPRKLFDRVPLETLKESITKRGVLVPVTVYRSSSDGKVYILDGERRWRCAKEIEQESGRKVPIPANVVSEPDARANLLTMLYREKWELMPTAKSLALLIKELDEGDEGKLSELTGLKPRTIHHCMILLSYQQKYQNLMMRIDPDDRVYANFFLEMAPVLDLYSSLGKRANLGSSREQLITVFLEKYHAGRIRSVINFRRILEAHDILKDEDRLDEFKLAAKTFLKNPAATIQKTFDPLVKEEKKAATVQEMCREFVTHLQQLKLEHTSRQYRSIRKSLESVARAIQALLDSLDTET